MTQHAKNALGMLSKWPWSTSEWLPKGVQHVKPIERVLDRIVVPGKVDNRYVKSQAVIDGVLDRSIILGDPYLGINHGLSQERFDDLSQRGSY